VSDAGKGGSEAAVRGGGGAEGLDLAGVFAGVGLVALTLSDPAGGAKGDLRAVAIRPVVVRGRRLFQIEERGPGSSAHRNVEAVEAAAEAGRLLGPVFRQADVRMTDADLAVRADASGRLRVRRRAVVRPASDAAHDRRKERLIPEGVPCPFLERLGVMTAEGRVRPSAQAKFRQVNRFLEIVADVADRVAPPPGGALDVVDLGCGKSYLTFALHHYLRAVRGWDARVTGIDRAPGVIETCRAVARDLAPEGLRFEVGEIGSAPGVERADLVVSLHACDTATDDALAQAVRWGARAILAAPCCQHELRAALRFGGLEPLLDHGALRERLAALVTDALRAKRLEAAGYDVQVMEFIETEHTPKNLLLRAVRRPGGGPDAARFAEYVRFRDLWGVRPHLDRAFRGLADA
jgi:SAM-dependent methyltransferase